jgi:hypothetical protein
MELIVRKLRQEQHLMAISRLQVQRRIYVPARRRRFNDIEFNISQLATGYDRTDTLAYLVHVVFVLQLSIT